MRRPFDARFACVIAQFLLSLTLASAGCDRKEEPISTASPTHTSAASAAAEAGSPRPIPTPADTSSRSLPAASRDPDWGLEPQDPAWDYVARYVRATKRYGAQGRCVLVKPSRFTGDRSVVETVNDASGACGTPGSIRDRFFVTVATDRMTLDESLHQPKLQSWPNGSDPDGPPGKVVDLQDLRSWRAGLRETFHRLELAPLRVQLYGRGTFPVISIAGWHGSILRDMTAAQLEAPAKALCDASGGEPMGIFAGVDRATLLRITCPGSGKFESL